jgi:methyl-accepting chemotaxis protein
LENIKNKFKNIFNKNFKLPIQLKMIVMGLVVVGVFIGFIIGYIVPNMANSLYEEKKTQLKQQVNIAYEMVEHFNSEEILGRLSREDAQKQCLTTLRYLQLGDDQTEYFWVNSMEPKMIMHPSKPELEGQDLTDYKDINGKAMFLEFVDICKQDNEGYSTYYWQYGFDKNRIEPKLSYVKLYKPWGWIIGTGMYTVDINESIDASKIQYSIIGIIIAVICALFIYFFSGTISRNIKKVVKVAKKLALGETNQTAETKSRDETGELGKAINEVVDYLKTVSSTAEKISDGDLSVQIQPKSKNDTLGNAFTNMIRKLNILIKQVAENAKSLSVASHQLNTVSEEAGQASQQIAQSSQQVAKGAAEQADSLSQATHGIQLLSTSIDQISMGSQEQSKSIERNVQIVNRVSEAINQTVQNAAEVNKGARLSAEYAQNGTKMAKETVSGMNTIKNTMSAASRKVHELGNRSKEIGTIVATIDDIADQTNLLALNAAIEAARAGEYGRGFAVVADEVRKLAERASSSTKEIAELINNIQRDVNETVDSISTGYKEIEKGCDLAANAGKALEDISVQAVTVETQINEIDDAVQELADLSKEMVNITDSLNSVVEENTASTEEMAASSKQVSQSVEGVAGVAQENSAASQQVSASSEQITAQVQQVVESAQELLKMASEMENAVSIFKTNGKNSSDEDEILKTKQIVNC